MIYFSDMYEWNEDYLERIMLHEMVHIFLYSSNRKADSKHGKRFKEVCVNINTKFGVNVPLDGSFISLTDEGLQQKNANKKTHNIFLLALNYLLNKLF